MAYPPTHTLVHNYNATQPVRPNIPRLKLKRVKAAPVAINNNYMSQRGVSASEE
jgi:hypothetical protein